MMRLIQKSLLHMGYIVPLDDTQPLIPLWTSHIPVEADKIIKQQFQGKYSKIKGVYVSASCNFLQLRGVLDEVKAYKKKHGVVPQYLVEELRTGFFSSTVSDLNQQRTNLHCYK